MKHWTNLTNPSQLSDILAISETKPVLIFKHSTRCSISSMALDRLNRKWKAENSDKISPYFLDLLSFREISNQIASDFKIEHQSPQVLLISKGTCVYDAAQNAIDLGLILEEVK